MWITIFIRFVIKFIVIFSVQDVFVQEMEAELGQPAVLCCTVYKRFCLFVLPPLFMFKKETYLIMDSKGEPFKKKSPKKGTMLYISGFGEFSIIFRYFRMYDPMITKPRLHPPHVKLTTQLAYETQYKL